MSNCTHENTEPVEVNSGGFGGLFDLFSDITVVVAHVCVDCGAQLPAWWGCEDCEIAEGNRAMGEMVPKMYLARACQRHREVL